MAAVEQGLSSAALAHLHPEFRAIFSQPTTSIVNAGRVLGRARNTAYKMAKDGLIPTTPTGRVPTAWLAREVGLLSRGEPFAA